MFVTANRVAKNVTFKTVVCKACMFVCLFGWLVGWFKYPHGKEEGRGERMEEDEDKSDLTSESVTFTLPHLKNVN